MVAALYLKHAYNDSDESLVARWSQDVYFNISAAWKVSSRGFRIVPPRSGKGDGISHGLAVA
jgi:hypothetical protein